MVSIKAPAFPSHPPLPRAVLKVEEAPGTNEYAVVAAFVLAVLLAAGAQAGPATGDEPPLPYVRGGSSWVYETNLGTAHVRLEEAPGVQGGARRYRWEIRLAGAGMQEALELRSTGLFTAHRSFSFWGARLWSLSFAPPELTIPLPLEVGRRWQARTSVTSGSATGWDDVDGAVEALERVDVPAGRYTAYRIRLLRTDTWGSRMDSVIWLDPEVGVVRAEGSLRWPGVVGLVQRLLGLDRLQVRLVEARLAPTSSRTGTPQAGGAAAPTPAGPGTPKPGAVQEAGTR